MGKIKMEKDKKKQSIAVDAPKDRVKLKQKVKAAKKVEEENHADGSDGEAPETVPIGKVDAVPADLNKKSKKKNKNKKKSESGSLLKIKGAGVEKRDPLLAKQAKLAKTFKKINKRLIIKTEEPEVEADPPQILATKDAIRTAVIAVRKATEEETKEKKQLFDKDFRYCLQICCTKIPRAPSREVRLPLPHKLYDDTDDICLVVRDEVRGKSQDFELTSAKYEQLFREQKIDFIKKVMTVRELKENYNTFELKRKLEQTYDLFLCDRIISAMVFGYLGKHFIEKRKVAVPVAIKFVEDSNLKAELLKGVHKTVYKQTSKGMTTAITVATHKLSVEEFVENIEYVLEQLKTNYPGGWVNIKNIYLKPMQHSAVSLPLYISTINPNMVKTPVIIGHKERHLIKVGRKLEAASKKYKLQEGGKLGKGTKRPLDAEKPKKKKSKKNKVKKEKADEDMDSIKEETVESGNEDITEKEPKPKKKKIKQQQQPEDNKSNKKKKDKKQKQPLEEIFSEVKLENSVIDKPKKQKVKKNKLKANQ